MFKKMILIIYFLVFYILPFEVQSQSIILPRISPQAKIFQTIGMSEVEITYSRPGVKGRKIWGQLVPFGSVWRAGADENTTIYLSNDAKINGNKILAGKFGFHIIPQENEWTIIFNKHHNSWGSFFFDENYDQLRIKVPVEKNEFREWLTYGFENLTNSTLDTFIEWENVKVKFTIEFDVVNITIDKIREQLRGIAGFGWQGPMQGANYCLHNNSNLDEALEWINQSIARSPTFDNLMIKANILERLNKIENIDEVIFDVESLLNTASEFQLTNYGYLLFNLNKLDEAEKVFLLNVEKHPNSWNTHDSLAEVLERKGDKIQAIKHYKKALELCPKDQKSRISEILNSLNEK